MTKVLAVVVMLCVVAVPCWSQFFPAPAPGAQPVPQPHPGAGGMGGPGNQMGGMMPGGPTSGMGLMGPMAGMGRMGGMMPGMGPMGGGSVAIVVDDGMIFIAAQGVLTVFELDENRLIKIAQAPYGPGPGPGYGPFGMPGGGPPRPGGHPGPGAST